MNPSISCASLNKSSALPSFTRMGEATHPAPRLAETRASLGAGALSARPFGPAEMTLDCLIELSGTAESIREELRVAGNDAPSRLTPPEGFALSCFWQATLTLAIGRIIEDGCRAEFCVTVW